MIDCGELPCTDDGPRVNSGRFDGMHNREAYDEIVEWLWEELKLPELKPRRSNTMDEPELVRRTLDHLRDGSG